MKTIDLDLEDVLSKIDTGVLEEELDKRHSDPDEDANNEQRYRFCLEYQIDPRDYNLIDEEESVDNADDERLLDELKSRNIEYDDEDYDPVSTVQSILTEGRAKAHDTLCDILGLMHTANTDAIIDEIKSIL